MKPHTDGADDLQRLVERIGEAVKGVNASYRPCLDPHVVIVDRRALDELLTATRALRARITQENSNGHA